MVFNTRLNKIVPKNESFTPIFYFQSVFESIFVRTFETFQYYILGTSFLVGKV